MPKRKPIQKRILGLIGEITMVMLGILLAFQVNSWAEHIKERKEEHRLLVNFVENLTNDIHQLDSLIAGTRQSMAKTDTIIDILNNPAPERLSTFLDLQPTLLFNYYFVTNDGAYQEASSTGRVELVEKTALREIIFEYYRLAGTTTNDDEVFETNTKINSPDWIELVGATREMMYILTGQNVKGAPKLKLSELAGNRKYLSILISVKAGGGVQIEAWNIRKNKAQALLSALEKELKRWA